jgi:hypothetical protein
VGCIGIPVVSNACVDFTGGESIFNHAVAGVQTPNGFICTFFQFVPPLSNETQTEFFTIVITGTLDVKA